MKLIHFAHANGVVPAVYQELLGQLGEHYQIMEPILFGQDLRYPIQEGWLSSADQLIDYVESQAAGKKVIAIGHSFGAVISLLATQKRPDLFSALIMLDPPMIIGVPSFFLMLGKKMGLVDRMTPAGISKHRRDEWPNRAAAAQLLRPKPFFKRFTDISFQAYINHGLMDNERGGVTLTVPKQQEIDVFRTIPSFFWLSKYCRVRIPTALLVGKASEFNLRGMTRLITKKMRIPLRLIEGGHMFPLQNPQVAAQMIHDMTTSLLGD